MQIDIPHQLPRLEAATRIKQMLTQLQHEHNEKINNVNEDWGMFTCNFSFGYTHSGFNVNITGTILVEPTNVKVTGELPLAAMLYQTAIEAAIREHAEKLLA